MRHLLLKFFLIGVLGVVFLYPGVAALKAQTPQNRPAMKIHFIIKGRTLPVTLQDSANARDFLSQLPLTLELEDYAATEKIADLPRPLSTVGAPPGITPVAGDIAYYAPWGNLAIFHKGFSYSSGLVLLGRLDTGLEVFAKPGRLQLRIEKAD